MWYVYFINPFSAFIWSLFHLNKRHAVNILWMFITYLGLTWSLAPNSSSDSVRYMGMVYKFYHSNYNLYEYYVQSGEIDFFAILLTYLVSRLTDNGWVLMIFQALIFGYFFSRNMLFVFKRLEGNIKPMTWLLFLTFFFVVPFWNFNGFRFWIAAHIFVYGFLLFIFNDNKKGLLLCFITPFVFHFSFFMPVLILCLFFILKNRIKLYFFFFLFSVLFAEININQFNSYMERYVPEKLIERSSGYTSEINFETNQKNIKSGIFESSKSWHAVLYKRGLVWSIYAFIVLFYFRRKKINNISPNLIKLFSFGLLFMGFANIFSNLPSGIRYVTIANMIILCLIVIYIQNSTTDLWNRRLELVTRPFFLIFLVVTIREGFYFISVTTIIGNPFIAPFTMGQNTPLDVLLK
jgi:hypothetical protein